jgi:ubiquitin-conjugating enzyme E2 W
VQADDLQVWQMDIQVLDDNPLYKGKTFRLNFRFTRNYPIEVHPYTIVFPEFGC